MGTSTELTTKLALQRRLARPISRKRWHARKRCQMIMVPKKHDWDTIMLQGAATKEVQKRPRKTISSGPAFRRLNRLPKEEK